MRVEYLIPAADNMRVDITLPDASIVHDVKLQYVPEPVVGLKTVPVGKFRAVGNSGRVEEADVVFDLKKATFVILPKRLHTEGFDFDKPEDDTTETVETSQAIIKRGGPEVSDSPVSRR
jgi:hypothetical protein